MIISFRSLFFTLLSAVYLVGCVNNYEKFYVDQTANYLDKNFTAHTGEPEIILGSADPDADVMRLLAQGYRQIGYSSFHATGGASQENLIAQAKKAGAAKVLAYQKYMNTEQGSMPLTLPNTQTTYHSGGVSAYGAGGSAYGSYSGTSTTYGTTTTHIPYTRHRYEYGATYWIKAKTPVFGAHFRDLTPEERTSIGSNKGSVIITPIDDSPAYKADIVPGDIVVGIDQDHVIDTKDLLARITKKRGQEISLKIRRGNENLTKIVKLNP